MTRPIFLSVCIAAYNVENYLYEALDSLRKSTLKNIEFIVVDDGSTDGTLSICKEFEVLDNRFKIYSHKKNLSLLQARKTGISKASGEYILFLDGDDKYQTKNLEMFCECLSKQDNDIVVFDVKCFGGNKEDLEKYRTYFSITKDVNLSDCQLLPRYIFQERSIPWNVINKAFKLSILKAINCKIKDIRLTSGEDALLTFLVLLHTNSCLYIPITVYEYRLGSGISTGTETIQKFKQHSRDILLVNYLDDVLQDFPNKKTNFRIPLEGLRTHLEINTVKRYFQLNKKDRELGKRMLYSSGLTRSKLFSIIAKLYLRNLLRPLFAQAKGNAFLRLAKRYFYR